MHYAVRPWPWILVALASLVLYPKDDVSQMKTAKKQYTTLITFHNNAHFPKMNNNN